MNAIIWLVIAVDILYTFKFLIAGWRVRFVPSLVFNDLFWARVGFLILFHVVMLGAAGFITYIGAIVSAVN